jgi:hypothetical protein
MLRRHLQVFRRQVLDSDRRRDRPRRDGICAVAVSCVFSGEVQREGANRPFRCAVRMPSSEPPMMASTDEVLMIAPRCAAIMWGSANRQPCMTSLRLTSKVRFQTSMSTSTTVVSRLNTSAPRAAAF